MVGGREGAHAHQPHFVEGVVTQLVGTVCSVQIKVALVSSTDHEFLLDLKVLGLQKLVEVKSGFITDHVLDDLEDVVAQVLQSLLFSLGQSQHFNLNMV